MTTHVHFDLSIDSGNAAFGEHPGPEIKRILNRVIEENDFQEQECDGYLRDINGNRVGEWRYEVERAPSCH